MNRQEKKREKRHWVNRINRMVDSLFSLLPASIQRKKPVILQFVKFGLVGASNTLVSFVVYYAFVFIDERLYMIGLITAWIVSVGNSFFWNNRFVFKDSSVPLIKRLFRTYTSYGIGLGIGLVLVFVEVELFKLSVMILPVINFFVTIPINFLLNKLWAFKKEKCMKVSDIIAQFLVDNGVRDVFLISGGGMMHMLDSVKRNTSLNLYFNLNEQATGICAESMAQFNNRLGVCLLTTGPGATNAVTGCAGAWLDSTPVLYISGQCKTDQLGQLKGLRFFGLQEVAIVPMVAPITKYAVTVLKKEEILYHLEKAVWLASHGRRGPVWIDVPLDVQGASVELKDCIHFNVEAEGFLEENTVISDSDMQRTLELLNASERPAILIGHGVVAANAAEDIRRFSSAFQIPVLSTWRAKGVFGDDEELYMGMPGIPAPRYANYCLQNADFVLIIGTRLNAVITAYDEKNFAFRAKKVIVDIDEKEIDKLSMSFEQKIVCDAGVFMTKLLEARAKVLPRDRTRWLSYCKKVKERYHLSKEVQPVGADIGTDGYLFTHELSIHSRADDIFVGSSSGKTCGISHMAYELKKGQKFVTSMGIGAMGWCIPSAIACCIAGQKRRTLVLEGDGSLQHNIQELALIITYQLPLKIFIFSNGGYASIYAMQNNNFCGELAGCTLQSGLGFPDIKNIADCYGLPYYKIENNSQINGVLDSVMADDSACLCEVFASIDFDEIPRSMTVVNKDGTFSSSKLENLYPFLSEDEVKDNMPDW